jgi:hypothetical protein
MTYQRLPYDDAASTPEMVADCAEVGRELRIPVTRHPADPALLGGTAGHEANLATPAVPLDLAEMAAGLELHSD